MVVRIASDVLSGSCGAVVDINFAVPPSQSFYCYPFAAAKAKADADAKAFII